MAKALLLALALLAAAAVAWFVVQGRGGEPPPPVGARARGTDPSPAPSGGLRGRGEAPTTSRSGASEGRFVLRGRVEDAHDLPLAGVSVRVVHATGPAFSTDAYRRVQEAMGATHVERAGRDGDVTLRGR